MPLRPPAGFISAFYDPLNNPNAPTIGTATGGDASASVTFTAPTNVGGSAISLYGARSTPENITATAASSPISVTGLTNGTAYTFAVWAINSYGPSAFSASSGSVTPAAPIAVFVAGVSSGANYNVMDYVTISTTGNATDFGDYYQEKRFLSGLGSSTRGVFAGGEPDTGSNMQYITIASTGNSTTFGSLTTSDANYAATCANSTRGLFTGFRQTSNVINYITIATTGNASDFGDLYINRYQMAGCASPTRGVFGGGSDGDRGTNVIQYVTIASTGNSQDFGDLITSMSGVASFSSSTRGLFSGEQDKIDYITIASTGNASNFGDLTTGRINMAGASSQTRGLFAGGGTSIGDNRIDYVTIASTGNALDFGDLTIARYALGGASNGHGGLQ